MSSPTAPEPAAAQLPSSPPVVQVAGVSVRYRVPHERIRFLKEYALRRLQRRTRYTDFWALRGVDFTVERGEAVGIIGHNGAGKSTLLKLIVGVLRPLEGRVRVRGRVAPLLELGTGFDHELTGRENVFLNGAILGWSRQDIAARFDRIVEFAGLREFIDAPLRTYSTGMAARLGFAVATDVAPDLLVLDEVLAVGDEEFQQRSTERIRRVHERGGATLVVSHNMNALLAMCRRVLWLDHGQVKAYGPAEEVVKQYKAAARDGAAPARTP
jgi:ABC-type polysaccharide/polyol phosphate transport system ATPase subunit